MKIVWLAAAVIATTSATLLDIPTVRLYNTADNNVLMPAIGLGTGAYGMENEPYGKYPECWDEVHPSISPPGPAAPGCGDNAARAVWSWLTLGGRRLDSANSYYNGHSVGQGISGSQIAREEIFIVSKVGPTFPLGYNDSIQQFEEIKEQLQASYVDLLLIHWPSIHPGGYQSGVSSDSLCVSSYPTYSEKHCRLSTWKGLLKIWSDKGARAVGVSNYNATHIQEIIDAQLPLPAANQISFNPYNARAQWDLVKLCQKYNITVLAYSPLGTPDFHHYPTTNYPVPLHDYPTDSGMSVTLLQDPIVLATAHAHGVSAAQVILNWEWSLGVPPNPRSMSLAHMTENLNIFNFTLTANEKLALFNRPQDYCSLDPDWYECRPDIALH